MELEKKIALLAVKIEEKTIARRRDLHRYPEAGWTEFRTASIVIETLQSLGYNVEFGSDAIDEENMMGVPSQVALEKQMQRAIGQGANPLLVEQMAGGKTGVVATMNFGKPGKTVALRFDMDCNDVMEAAEEKHRPYKEGFVSVNSGCMHACGHDGHTAAGLAVAEILAEVKDELAGTVKFIFQPAEEGVRGAKAMMMKGVVDDVDYLLGAHLMKPKVGYLAYDVQGFYATSKFDAVFKGLPAHAGAAPEVGKNALLAAANAAINLQAISRHSAGSSRINVGTLHAGSGRNVIAAEAVIGVETRGATSDVNAYMYEQSEQIIKSAAAMYENEVSIIQMGSAAGGNNSPELSAFVGDVAKKIGIFDTFEVLRDIGGSEDCSYFMEKVQKNGGQAAYLIIGADIAAIHHNSYFDFDERALGIEARLLSTVACALLMGKRLA